MVHEVHPVVVVNSRRSLVNQVSRLITAFFRFAGIRRRMKIV